MSVSMPYELCSNDGIWESRVELSKSLMSELLRNPAISIVHPAVHGNRQGLILRWSKEPAIRDRVPIELLTPSDIRFMSGWNQKLVVSGACRSAELAPDFLKVPRSRLGPDEMGFLWPILPAPTPSSPIPAAFNNPNKPSV